MTLEERVEELERITGAITEALNDKTDRDARNLSGGGKALISGLGMPSGRYIDLTPRGSGVNEIAPANGFIFFEAQTISDTNYQYGVFNVTGSVGTCFRIDKNGVYFQASTQVKKGDTYLFRYEGPVNFGRCRFIYAEGEE